MAKKMRSFRFGDDVSDMLKTLTVFLSSEKNLKLNETQVLELLVTERYKKLLKDGVLII